MHPTSTTTTTSSSTAAAAASAAEAAAAAAASSSTSRRLFSVAGKNVLITGGSRGIGFMIAKGFCAAGANVLLTSRDEKACQQAADALQCHYVVSNVSNRAGCEALAAHVATVFGGGEPQPQQQQPGQQPQPGLPQPQQRRRRTLDVLINNAGTSWGEPLERESGQHTNWGWDKVMDLNVKGMFYLTRACIPLLQQPQQQQQPNEKPTSTETHTDSTTTLQDDDDGNNIMDPGRIINIGSVAGLIPQSVPTHAYDVSKAAVHHLTKKFAGDLARYGITVNCVAPGYVPSRMSAGLLATWGADPQRLAHSIIPLQRFGTEDDMAGACIYLSSHAGSWCTGVILNVDGGQVGALQIPVSSLSDL